MIKQCIDRLGDFAGTSDFSKEKKLFKKMGLPYPYNRQGYNSFLSTTDEPEFFHKIEAQFKKDLLKIAEQKAIDIENLSPKEKIARKDKGGLFSDIVSETIEATPEQVNEFNENMQACAQKFGIPFPRVEEVKFPFTPYKGTVSNPKLKINFNFDNFSNSLVL